MKELLLLHAAALFVRRCVTLSAPNYSATKTTTERGITFRMLP